MSVHVATLLLGHVIHVASGADLVIRIPGGGQPQDGFYRLDYRWVVYDTCNIFVISRVRRVEYFRLLSLQLSARSWRDLTMPCNVLCLH